MYYNFCHDCRNEVETPIYGDGCPKCGGIESVRYIFLWQYTPENRYYGVSPKGLIYNEQGQHIATELRGEN